MLEAIIVIWLIIINKCYSVATNVVFLFGGLFLYSSLLFLSVHIEPSVSLLKEEKSYPMVIRLIKLWYVT